MTAGVAITIKATAQRFQPLWQNLVVWPQFWHLTVVSSNLESKTQKFGEVFAFQIVSILNVTESKFLQNSCQHKVVFYVNEDRYYVVDYIIKHERAIFTTLFKNEVLLMPESIQLDRVKNVPNATKK